MSRKITRTAVLWIASLALAGCERRPAPPPIEVGDAAAAVERLTLAKGAVVVNLFANW